MGNAGLVRNHRHRLSELSNRTAAARGKCQVRAEPDLLVVLVSGADAFRCKGAGGRAENLSQLLIRLGRLPVLLIRAERLVDLTARHPIAVSD